MLNKATLIGRLGKDPEVRTLESGVHVATFSVATTENWKDKDGNKKESTEWHNIVLWRGLAEIAAKYLHKGDLVYLEGKITTRKWEKDGVTRYTTEIVGDTMKMLSTKKSSSTGGEAAPEPTAPPEGGKPTDDLPF